MPTYRYPTLTSTQRRGTPASTLFCAFFAAAGEVTKWAASDRIEESTGGFQRMINPAKVRGIKRFFEKDPQNSIPTALILTLKVASDPIETVACANGHTMSF